MSWWNFASNREMTSEVASHNRRKEPRIGGHFNVRYSGMYAGEIIMGQATIIDLSRYGFGLKGGRGLELGMELSLFLEMSDMDMVENLCIPQAYVAWIDGRRFGVEVRSTQEKKPVWLEYLA